MIFLGLRIDQNVIKKNQSKIPQIGPEDFIHQTLKSGRGIGEAKWHDSKFIVPQMSSKSCFFYIPFFQPDLVVASS